MESKYLNRFQKAASLLPLRGNRILVEILPKEEIKSAGGLIIASNLDNHRTKTEQQRAKLAIVLAVGTGYYDDSSDEGEDVPLDVQPGNVVMLSDYGLKYYSEFPGLAEFTGDSLALALDKDVHCAWESIEAYQEYSKALNS